MQKRYCKYLVLCITNRKCIYLNYPCLQFELYDKLLVRDTSWTCVILAGFLTGRQFICKLNTRYKSVICRVARAGCGSDLGSITCLSYLYINSFKISFTIQYNIIYTNQFCCSQYYMFLLSRLHMI